MTTVNLMVIEPYIVDMTQLTTTMELTKKVKIVMDMELL